MSRDRESAARAAGVGSGGGSFGSKGSRRRWRGVAAAWIVLAGFAGAATAEESEGTRAAPVRPGLDEAPPPILVPAIRVTLRDRSTLEGLDGGEDAKALTIIQMGVKRSIPKAQIEAKEAVELPSLTVEAAESTFQRERAALRSDSAAEWIALARKAEYLQLPAEAHECLERARDADPGLDSDAAFAAYARRILETRQDREIVAIEKSPRASLAAVAKSLELCDRFEETWPDSEKCGIVARERAELLEARHRLRVEYVRTEFFKHAELACGERAGNTGAGIEEALRWAREDCLREVLTRLGRGIGVEDPVEVLELWQARGKTMSPRQYSYGSGSFVIDSSALPVPPFPDEWWRAAKTSTAERKQFLVAFFGEHAEFDGQGGFLTATSGKKVPCSDCAGTGTKKSDTNVVPGGVRKETTVCPRCKKLTADRTVVLR